MADPTAPTAGEAATADQNTEREAQTTIPPEITAIKTPAWRLLPISPRVKLLFKLSRS